MQPLEPMRTVIYVRRKEDVPKEKHWAILKFGSIHIPGDERSRTNPGHGYPAEDRAVVEYEAFTNIGEWREAINKLELQKNFPTAYVAIEVNPAKVEVRTSVTVS